MNINRRHLALPALAIGLLGVVPAFAALADEDAVATSVEAFRAAPGSGRRQSIRRALRGGAQLQPLGWPSRGQGDLHRQRHQWKIEIFIACLSGPQNSCSQHRSDRAVSLGGRKRSCRRWQEKRYQSPHPDELAKTGRGLETSISRGNQALIASNGPVCARWGTKRGDDRINHRPAYAPLLQLIGHLVDPSLDASLVLFAARCARCTGRADDIFTDLDRQRALVGDNVVEMNQTQRRVGL